jgi:hypothetical protein
VYNSLLRKILRIILPLAFCAVTAPAQSGLFTVGGSFPVGADPDVHSTNRLLAVADFNHDGNLDIAHADESQGTVTVLLGDGKGNFAAAPGSPIQVSGGAVDVIGTGDFNGDGNADLVVSSGASATTEILLGDGHGGFTPGAGFASGSSVGGSS